MYTNRYERNGTTITGEERLILKEKKILVAGCGGLGGYVIEMLARAGVGKISAVDPDVFDETNLNRQLLCEEALLGSYKVDAALGRAGRINSEVEITPLCLPVSSSNGKEILAGHDLVIDALDNIPNRFDLQEAAEALSIPLVHGAISGWYGQVAVIKPGDRFFDKIYPERERTIVDRERGNPSFSPAVVAGFQVCEALKLILGKGEILSGRMLFIDMLTNHFELIEI